MSASRREHAERRRGQGSVELPDDAIAYVDRQLVVVRKPPGIVTVPPPGGGEVSLVELVRERLARRHGRAAPLGVVQRLDRETSGLLVFARTLESKRHLGLQLRRHTVTRRYLAIVAGVAVSATFDSWLIDNRGDGRRGTAFRRGLGKRAITHVTVLEHLVGATLVECRLETGRTHQIRIHLGEAGHPVLGERTYAPRGLHVLSAPRLMLHAGVLAFEHPTREHRLEFEQPLPADMLQQLESLRTARSAEPASDRAHAEPHRSGRLRDGRAGGQRTGRAPMRGRRAARRRTS